jgi:hypothetical protein
MVMQQPRRSTSWIDTIPTGFPTALNTILNPFYPAIYISFDMIENANPDGNVNFVFEEIQPGGQMVFNVTVRPKLYGIYESTRARLKYNSGSPNLEVEDEDIRRGSSSSLGRTRIISTADYLRETSYYVKEWTIFSVSFAVAIIVPFYNWQSLRQKKYLSKSR